MKKLLLIMTLVLSMLVTACGNKNPFVGTWRGTWDMTSLMEDAMQNNELEEFGSFKDLTVDIIFTFDEEEVEMEVDEDSLKELGDKIEEQMLDIFDAYIEDFAEENGYSVDDLYAQLGTTREETVKELIDEMDMDSMIDELSEELKAECGYTYDEEDGVIELESDEEMEYEFDGKDLLLSFEYEGDKIEIECEKEK